MMTDVNKAVKLQVNILVNTKGLGLMQKPDSKPLLHQGATKTFTVADFPLHGVNAPFNWTQ